MAKKKTIQQQKPEKKHILHKVQHHVRKIYDDKFKRYLVLTLLIIGVLLLLRESGQSSFVPSPSTEGKIVHFFYLPTCPHCHAQMPFNDKLKERYPEVTFVYHDVSDPAEAAVYAQYADEAGIPAAQRGVPFTVLGKYYVLGFDDVDNKGKELEDKLKKYISGEQASAVSGAAENKTSKKITLPLIGEIDVMTYSLPALTVLLGLIDGFNPCAMWVLVYLISLILALNDKRKIWLLVGSFLFASGVLYFLFMTAWLNVFLLVGYIRPLTILIGLFALGVGISNIKEYIETKGALACDVGDMQSKQKTMSRMQQLVASPLTWATIFGIIALAFVINSIEFVCSSAIPAVYTQVLALSNLSGWAYYGYILLYDIFFMLDDLIIFSLAVFAVNSSVGDKYAKYCKLIGGAILLLLGLMLAFAPQLLR